MGVGSSQLPSQNELPADGVEVPAGRTERKKWSPIEDIVLCSAWLNTSKDCVVGNEQKLNTFWKRITNYLNASPKLAAYEDRNSGQCKHRWQKINEGVQKFVGSFEAASRQRSSGQNDDDVMRLAYEIFEHDHKSKFNFEHAWIELKNDQKWCGASTVMREGGSKRRKKDDQPSSSKTVAEEVQARPEGVKAAKAKGKKKVASEKSDSSSSLMNVQSMWSVREKDLALRKELGKQKLLENLLSKTEPLTEIECALKDKLMTDMLSN